MRCTERRKSEFSGDGFASQFVDAQCRSVFGWWHSAIHAMYSVSDRDGDRFAGCAEPAAHACHLSAFAWRRPNAGALANMTRMRNWLEWSGCP